MPFTAPRPDHPKALGAFYTPATVAGLLADWVVRSGAERLLEPSVGEGALMEAAIARARTIGGGASHLRFLACDVNPAVIEAILPKLPIGSEARAIDFMQLELASTGKFQGIIANPPFTRNHALASIRRAILRDHFAVSGAAGLWVHFLLHALDFLAPGGRLAAVVPASALFSNYGRTALERIAAQFRTVDLRQIVNKPLWVNGADERGAIILAEGYRQGASAIPEPTPWPELGETKNQDDASDRVFDRLAALTAPLRSFAALKIGAVTGCNAVFLMTEEERLAIGVNRSDVIPIIGRARQVRGLCVGSAELVEQATTGERTWLLAPRTLGARGGPVRRQLAKIPARRRAQTLWFKKRSPWWLVDAGEACHAVFTYMNHHGPRLVLAGDQVRCTNTLHQVRFEDYVSHEQRIAAALSMISTFGQLAAERIGRSYGGGVLKFELTEARQMPILPPRNAPLDLPLLLADQALRLGDRETARDIADEALIAPVLGETWQQSVSAMASELRRRRAVRQGRPS